MTTDPIPCRNGAGGNDRDDCPSIAAVTGLAREVEALRKGMKHTASAGDLKRLADTVAELGDTIGATAGGGGAEATPPASWLAWQDSATQAGVLVGDLAAWMAGIYLRYADAEGLPECWLWHPEVVEELLWLMQAWLAAYESDFASVRLAGDWHDRLRPGVVRRIKESYAKACSLENHTGSRTKAAPQVPVVDAVEAMAAWWADHRDEVAPEPTEDQMLAAAQAWRRVRSGGNP